MADSYAQLAKKSALLALHGGTGPDRTYPRGSIPNLHQSVRAPSDSQFNIHDIEDKVLSLAKLLKSSQLCHDDHAADQTAGMKLLSSRIQKLEEAVGKQAISNSFASGPNAYNIKALAERLVLVEGRLMDGLTENQEVHAHNAKFFDGIEDRLSKIEAQLSVDREAQMAELQATLGPNIDRLVRARLDAFEGEVQARLLIATAGAVRRRVTGSDAAISGGGREPPGKEERIGMGEGSALGAPHEDLDSLRWGIQQLTESVADFKAEQAANIQHAITRSELQAVVEHLHVVADTHASMQLAVSQLKTVCPELSRILSLMKDGNEPGGRSSSLSKQSQAAGLLMRHAETLTEVLSGQLDRACSISTSIQSDLLGGPIVSPDAPAATTSDSGLRPPLRSLLSSNLCKVIEETRESVASLSMSLKQSVAEAGQQITQPFQQRNMNVSSRSNSQGSGVLHTQPPGVSVRGKENSGATLDRAKGCAKVTTHLIEPLGEKVPGSAEKRHARLRQMYSELKHLN